MENRDQLAILRREAARLLPRVERAVATRQNDTAYLDTLTSIDDLYWNALSDVCDAAYKRYHWSLRFRGDVHAALTVAYFLSHPHAARIAHADDDDEPTVDDERFDDEYFAQELDLKEE